MSLLYNNQIELYRDTCLICEIWILSNKKPWVILKFKKFDGFFFQILNRQLTINKSYFNGFSKNCYFYLVITIWFDCKNWSPHIENPISSPLKLGTTLQHTKITKNISHILTKVLYPIQKQIELLIHLNMQKTVRFILHCIVVSTILHSSIQIYLDQPSIYILWTKIIHNDILLIPVNVQNTNNVCNVLYIVCSQ